MNAKSKARVRWEAKVIRASGEVDDFGVISDSRWGPVRRWWANQRIKRINKRRGL